MARAKNDLVELRDAIVETLPADVMTAEVRTLGAREALGRAALSGVHRLIEIVEQPLWRLNLVEGDLAYTQTAIKQQRLLGDMGIGAAKLYMQAAESEFRMRRGDALAKLLEAIAEEDGEA